MPNENLYLHKTFLWEVLQARPDRSKDGFRQQFIWREFLQWKDFGSRNILTLRSKSQNQLAGLYGPQGQALPSPDVSGEQWLSTMMDVKAAEQVDPDIVKDDFRLGELAVVGGLNTGAGREIQARVTEYITRKMAKAEDRVDNMLEYLTIGSLLNAIVWPPVDDAGDPISPAPPYWNADMAGTWSIGLPTEQKQVITSLVDWNGDAATADQKKVWTDASADIVGAIDVLDQIALNNHAFSIYGGTLICRSSLLDGIIKNTAILSLIRGSNLERPGAPLLITKKQLREAFIDVIGLRIRTYDSFWTYEAPAKGADYTPSVVHYLPEDTAIIIPPNFQGGFMGTAPLENEAGQWNPGMLPWLYKEQKPNWRREMGVNVTAWPIYDNTDWMVLTGLQS